MTLPQRPQLDHMDALWGADFARDDGNEFSLNGVSGTLAARLFVEAIMALEASLFQTLKHYRH